MAINNVKSKDSKVVAVKADQNGNVIIDINTRVVLREEVANMNIKSQPDDKVSLTNDRHLVSKLSTSGSLRKFFMPSVR